MGAWSFKQNFLKKPIIPDLSSGIRQCIMQKLPFIYKNSIPNTTLQSLFICPSVSLSLFLCAIICIASKCKLINSESVTALVCISAFLPALTEYSWPPPSALYFAWWQFGFMCWVDIIVKSNNNLNKFNSNLTQIIIILY